MQIDKFVMEWLGSRSEDSARGYTSDLQIFKQYLDSMALTEDTFQRCHMRHFVKWSKSRPNFVHPGEPISDSTVQRQVSTIRCYYRWKQDSNPELVNPADGFRYRRTGAAREVLPVEPDVADKMCSGNASKLDIALVQTFRYSGVRLRELIRLNKDSITVQRETDISGVERVYGTARVLGKRRKARMIALNEIALNAISEYLEERGEDDNPALFVSASRKRISRRTVQRHIRALAFDTAAVHAHPHQFRHSFTTELMEAGVQDTIIQKLLGHKCLSTTFQYGHVSDKTVARQYYAARAKIESKANESGGGS